MSNEFVCSGSWICLLSDKNSPLSTHHSSLVTSLREMNLFIFERLLVQHGALFDALILPRGNVRIVDVVAQRLAVFGLILFAKMAAARFIAVQRIEDQQFA